MPTEIERKFLVKNTDWLPLAEAPMMFQQAYLAETENINLRIRIRDNTSAKLTIKSAKSGLSREEFEYEIPLEDAKALMKHVKGSIIEKQRYVVSHEYLQWEIDIFHGDNEGLIIAEIELASETQNITLPHWIGEEVTLEKKYYNAALSQNPYKNW